MMDGFSIKLAATVGTDRFRALRGVYNPYSY